MPFVVEAVLWTSIAVSVVLVMYMLVRRWLLGTALSPWRPATLLSDGPPHRGHHPAWPPGALSGDRQGFGRVPSLLRGGRACSATQIAGTLPSANLLSPVLVR